MSAEVVKMSEKPSPMQKLSLEMERDLDAMIRVAEMQMKLRRVAYEAALKHGFTEEQALSLCR